jgi:hypothetical protein
MYLGKKFEILQVLDDSHNLERLSVNNYLPNFNDIYRSDPPNESPEVVESTHTWEAPKAYDKLILVQRVHGRFPVRLQKGWHAHTFIFSSQKEVAETRWLTSLRILLQDKFELTEKEQVHIEVMEWEDLLLEMQLQDSRCRFSYTVLI